MVNPGIILKYGIDHKKSLMPSYKTSETKKLMQIGISIIENSKISLKVKKLNLFLKNDCDLIKIKKKTI